MTQQSVKAALVRLVVEEELPFTMIDADVFRNFAELCNPLVVPHLIKSTALAETVIGHFRSTQDVIKNLLAKETHISLTGDTWTSSNGKSIFGITAHWIDTQFKPFQAIIAMKQVVGAHTGINLAQHLAEVLETYDISD